MTRIAAIQFPHYPQDNRPRREAEALVEAGMSVDIICLRADGQPTGEVVHGVRVQRISMKKKVAENLVMLDC